MPASVWPHIQPGRECGNAEHAERKTADFPRFSRGRRVGFPAGVGFFLPNAAKGQAQPALDFTVAPSTISERNGTATITVPITNSVVFATDQVIALSFAGTAIPSGFTVEDASNFALTSPYQLILAAGETSVAATIEPVDDDVYEGDEIIEVAASLSGTAIGSAQTVTDEADRAKVTQMARLDPGGIARRRCRSLAIPGAGCLRPGREGTGAARARHHQRTRVVSRAPPINRALATMQATAREAHAARNGRGPNVHTL